MYTCEHPTLSWHNRKCTIQCQCLNYFPQSQGIRHRLYERSNDTSILGRGTTLTAQQYHGIEVLLIVRFSNCFCFGVRGTTVMVGGRANSLPSPSPGRAYHLFENMVEAHIFFFLNAHAINLLRTFSFTVSLPRRNSDPGSLRGLSSPPSPLRYEPYFLSREEFSAFFPCRLVSGCGHCCTKTKRLIPTVVDWGQLGRGKWLACALKKI